MHLQFFIAYRPDTPGSPTYCSSRICTYAASDDPSAEASAGCDPQDIAAFCFPLGQHDRLLGTNDSHESFTFSLAGSGLSMRHGFCRRCQQTQPDASPKVLCIVAPEPWFQLVFRALEVLEQILTADNMLASASAAQLPPSSNAATFLTSLRLSLQQSHAPGVVLRVPLPRAEYRLRTASVIVTHSVSRDESLMADAVLGWGQDFVELQVPPECFPGSPAPTVPLACLLLALRPSIVATLFAAMLMERRIIVTASCLHTLTRAVHAAAALLYPFAWHHIFLPLLPSTFLDYLSSPTPFLIGLPAYLRGAVDWAAMDAVVVVDLDLNTIEPAVGSVADDGALLPGRERLVTAFATIARQLHSTRQYDANADISAIVQEFLVATVGRYRKFLRPQGDEPRTPAAAKPGHLFTRVKSRLTHTGASFMRSPSDATTGGGPSRLSSLQSGASLSYGTAASETADRLDVIDCGQGQCFYHSHFAASFVRSRARLFAESLLHTQLWQVFIHERAKLVASGGAAADPFEQRIEQRNTRVSALTSRLGHTLSKVRGPTAAAAQWTSAQTRSMFNTARSYAGAMKDALSRQDYDQSRHGTQGGRDSQHDVPFRHPQFFFDDVDDELDFPDGSARRSAVSNHRRAQSAVPTMSTHDLSEAAFVGGSGATLDGSLAAPWSPHAASHDGVAFAASMPPASPDSCRLTASDASPGASHSASPAPVAAAADSAGPHVPGLSQAVTDLLSFYDIESSLHGEATVPGGMEQGDNASLIDFDGHRDRQVPGDSPNGGGEAAAFRVADSSTIDAKSAPATEATLQEAASAGLHGTEQWDPYSGNVAGATATCTASEQAEGARAMNGEAEISLI